MSPSPFVKPCTSQTHVLSSIPLSLRFFFQKGTIIVKNTNKIYMLYESEYKFFFYVFKDFNLFFQNKKNKTKQKCCCCHNGKENDIVVYDHQFFCFYFFSLCLSLCLSFFLSVFLDGDVSFLFPFLSNCGTFLSLSLFLFLFLSSH